MRSDQATGSASDPAEAAPDATPDDRTARARIRDAAIARFATDGVRGASVRAIADDAGVSPALVMHHFGSKARLLSACDEHVAATIRDQKHTAMAAGPGFDPLAALRDAEAAPPLLPYLARRLIDSSPEVDRLVDDLVADAVEYMEAGVASGALRPTAHPVGRAALLTLWSLGAVVLHDHVRRLLGVDLTGPVADLVGADGYYGPALEMFTDGLMTDEMAAQMRAAFAPRTPDTPTPTSRQERS